MADFVIFNFVALLGKLDRFSVVLQSMRNLPNVKFIGENLLTRVFRWHLGNRPSSCTVTKLAISLICIGLPHLLGCTGLASMQPVWVVHFDASACSASTPRYTVRVGWVDVGLVDSQRVWQWNIG